MSEARKGKCYNKFTEETRKRMSEAQKGKQLSEDTKKKIKVAFTKEVRKKLSEARKGRTWKLVDGKRVYSERV